MAFHDDSGDDEETNKRKPGVLIKDDDFVPTITIEELMARQPKPICTEDEAMEAYRTLFEQSIKHSGSASKFLAGILLNSYADSLGHPFEIREIRCLDRFNLQALLRYLDFYCRTSGWYPPEDDIEALEARWPQTTWASAEHSSE